MKIPSAGAPFPPFSRDEERRASRRPGPLQGLPGVELGPPVADHHYHVITGKGRTVQDEVEGRHGLHIEALRLVAQPVCPETGRVEGAARSYQP